MAIRVSLFSLIFLSSSLLTFSLYEDQVSLMDWHQQYLGKVKQTIFHTQKAGGKRLVVSTNENVIASLDPRRGEIFWRHVLGEKDPIDYIDIALGKYVVTLSSKGSILRAWNLPDGQMVWESFLVGKKPSGSSLLTVIDLKADCDNAILVYSNGCLLAISSIDGAVLWNLELESVELQQLIQPVSDNVMYAVGFSGSSKLNAYGINIKTGELLYQEVVDFPSGELSLISSETSVALNEDHSFMLEELAISCGLELIHVKQVYENIDDQTLTKKHVRKALDTLDLQKKQNIFKCLRENYVTSPISGEDAHPIGWFHKILDSHLPKLTPNVDLRRILAQAPSPTDDFSIPIPGSMSPPTTKNGGGNSASVSTTGNEGGGNSHTTIVVAVVVTAVVTFFVALCLYCCCRKAFNGGSSLEHKDDRPLLSLSMSDYAASGSSKAWGFENSTHKDKMGSNMNSSAVEFSNNVVASEAAIRSSNVSSDSNVLPSQKPPPGLPPLKPPPGRKDLLPPLSPEPRVSLKPATNSGDRPPPPPPPKPSVAAPPPPKPRAPPPPPNKGPPPPPPNKGPPPPPNKGPSPLGPPPPPAKPGPKAPPGQLNKSRLPPVSGSSSDDASKTKLKPFFWDKVQANPEHSMVWGQLQSGSFQFNEDMIESLFGLASTENKNEKKKQSSARDPSTQFIQIIEPKKAQNLSILLKALNVTTDEVHDALVEGNELPSELLETLLKMAPTAEEELKLRLFNDEISKLGQAERFLKVLVDVPFAFKRLETLLFMCTLNEEATSVKESFITLEAACKELRNSRLFLKLLEAVLKTGNRMNDGTYRGGAQAFKLDTLLKLADVKGTDGKTTLLHFVVQEIIRSEGVRAYRTSRESKSVSSIKSEDFLEDVTGDSEEHLRSLGLQVVSGLGDQLENVKKAACLDSDSVTRTLAKLGNSLLKAKNFLGKEMEEVDEVNGFHEALKSFIGHSEGEVMKLLEEEKRIMALVKSTVDYFHGNSGKEEGLRLFVIVRDFLIMLDKACRDVKAKPLWPAKEDQKKDDEKKKDPPSRQTSTETPRTTFSSDFRQKFFPAIAERRTRNDGSSSDED